MFRFAHIFFLYGLLLIPVFTFLFALMLRWRKKSLQKFGDWNVIHPLIPDISTERPILKFIFLMLAYTFLIIGLADPQIGSKVEKVHRKGVDLMICMDVSNSMLAEDIKPNRLERAKQAISRLIDNLEDDRIGIVVFAGKAYIQLPITTDFGAAKLFLSTINTDIVPTQGTAIGDAIDIASRSFDNNKRSRAIIIISDGENHEDDAVAAAKAAEKKGIYTYTIGMGLAEGAPIPIRNNEGIQVGFKKDMEGSTVISKLDEAMLQEIAHNGKGIYVRANNSETGMDKIFEGINKMEKNEYQNKMFSDYSDRFQYFFAVAIVLLIVELMLSERKPKWAEKINLFGKKTL